MTAGRAISVCVVDDHPVIAEGIRRIIEAITDICWGGAAATPAELEALLSHQRIDVAILDVRLVGANGIELCASLTARFPEMRVLMLSSFGDTATLRRALAAGASGFAVKSISLDMLPAAIRQVHAGGVYLSTEFVADSIRSRAGHGALDLSLTAREREIVFMVSEGKANKEIARELGLSSHTIKLHVGRLLKRFGYKSRSQLSALAE